MRPPLAPIALASLIGACTPAAPPPTTPSAATADGFSAGDPPVTPGPGSTGALGSGCAPNAEALPDGAWFGFATRWDASGVDFDLACYYVGEAAAAQASAHNAESPPPNDFFIVNDNTATRRANVSADAVAYRVSNAGGPIALERTTFADLVANPGAAPCPGAGCAVWLFVNGGRVTEVMQQYSP